MLNGVMTTAEAAQIWHMQENTIRIWCTGQKGYPPKFHKGEFTKSGATWLVTREGMERLHGKQKKSD